MNLPTGPYLDEAIPALRTALTSAGFANASKRVAAEAYQGIPYPYILVDAGTVFDFSDKTTEGGEIAVTFIAWSDSHDEAITVAGLIVSTLTSRSTPILPTGYTVAYNRLDIVSGVIQQEAGGSQVRKLFGIPVRIRAKLIEAA